MLDLLIGLLSGRDKFYFFELKILDALKSNLAADSRTRFQDQIDAVNKVQRMSGGKEVNLYTLRHGKAEFDDNLRFPHFADEALLATINLASADRRAKLKVDIWLVKGRLFSLLFNQSPKQFYAGSDLKTVHPDIVDVRVWFNPAQPDLASLNEPGEVVMGEEWLRIWEGKGGLDLLNPPLQEADRLKFLERIDAVLPYDYLAFVAQSEGATSKGCVIYGLSEIGQLVSSDSNYYALADVDGVGVLAVKAGKRPELYLLHHDGEPEPLGISFFGALERLLLAQC